MSYVVNYVFRATQQLCSKAPARLVSPVTVRYALGNGFSVESLNPNGHVQPWSILALADFSFNFHYLKIIDHKKSFLDFDQFLPYTVFFAAADVSIDEKMFDLSLDKSQFDVEYSLCHVGRTSITLKFELFPSGSQEKLSTGRLRTVLVNRETRKPQPFPAWWTEKYSPFLPNDAAPFSVSSGEESAGEKLYMFKTQVVPSLLDSNLHSGWYFQVKTYLDAYVSWHFNKFGIDGNSSAFRNAKYIKLLFRNEASLGDELNINMHADPRDGNSFQFFMANEKAPVSECLIEFYPNNKLQDRASKL